MKYIYSLHKTMMAQNLVLVYEGEFTQEITKSVLAMAERNMDLKGEESTTKRKVFNVMVECLQNIVKHSDRIKSDGLGENAIFIIGEEKGEYRITSGNPIETDSVEDLKARLDKINSLDKDGLKALYKDIIKATTISEKGGAGLGFIDMARKSGQELLYDFEPMNDNFSFFTLQTTVRKES